jgi:uncharacterized protein (DUF2147 family)
VLIAATRPGTIPTGAARPTLRQEEQMVHRLAGMIAMLLLATATRAEAGAIDGVWLTGKKEVGVELYECDEGLCGKIVWLAKPRWSDNQLKRDERNPDPALRDRHWCGIEVISGLTPDGGNWESGDFYYPKDGKTYDIDIEPRGDGTLKVRAYLGVKLLGKTEIWTRPDGSLGGCIDAS